MRGAAFSAVNATSGGAFYMFGGFSGVGELLGDLLLWDGVEWMLWDNGTFKNATSYTSTDFVDTISLPGVGPGARHSPVSVTDSDGNLWLVGGWGYDLNGDQGYLNDVWMFNSTSYTWSNVSLLLGSNSSFDFGIILVPSLDNIPPGRMGAAGWCAEDNMGNKLILVFGGESEGGSRNDLWRFNTTSGIWTWLSGNDTNGHHGIYPDGFPSARVDATTFITAEWRNSSHFYIFGGYSLTFPTINAYSDLWRYNTVSNTWELLNGDNSSNPNPICGDIGESGPSNIPGPRFGAKGAWNMQTDLLYLFGGYGKNCDLTLGYLSELWYFNITNSQWTCSRESIKDFGSTTASSTVSPIGRDTIGSRVDSFLFVDLSGNLFLYGGKGFDVEDSLCVLGDFWAIINCGTLSSVEIENSTRSSAGCGFGGGISPKCTKFFFAFSLARLCDLPNIYYTGDNPYFDFSHFEDDYGVPFVVSNDLNISHIGSQRVIFNLTEATHSIFSITEGLSQPIEFNQIDFHLISAKDTGYATILVNNVPVVFDGCGFFIQAVTSSCVSTVSDSTLRSVSENGYGGFTFKNLKIDFVDGRSEFMSVLRGKLSMQNVDISFIGERSVICYIPEFIISSSGIAEINDTRVYGYEGILFYASLSSHLTFNRVEFYDVNKVFDYFLILVAESELILRDSYCKGCVNFLSIGNAEFVNMMDNFTFVETRSEFGTIIVSHGAFLKIVNSNFRDNTFFNGGCSVRVMGALIINRTKFENITSLDGGAGPLLLESSYTIIENCEFRGNFKQNGLGGAMIATLLSNVVVLNSLFIENGAGQGGAIFIDHGSAVNMSGCNFTGNYASSGGAVEVSTFGKLFLEDSYFSNNTAYIGGGAIETSNYGEIMSTGNSFIGNAAGSMGGALSLGYISRLSDVFTSNTAQEGGAIYAGNEANVNVLNAELFNNSAEIGGALSSKGKNVQVSVTSSIFTNNTAISTGGALSQIYGSLSVSSSTIEFNEAADYGGGMAVIYADYLELLNVSCQNNSMSEPKTGGGCLLLGDISKAEIVNCTFKGNVGARSGGAIMATKTFSFSKSSLELLGGYETSSFNITRSIFLQNDATDYGGAVTADSIEVWSIRECDIVGNVVQNGAGGGVFWIAHPPSEDLLLSGNTIQGNTASLGRSVASEAWKMNATVSSPFIDSGDESTVLELMLYDYYEQAYDDPNIPVFAELEPADRNNRVTGSAKKDFASGLANFTNAGLVAAPGTNVTLIANISSKGDFFSRRLDVNVSLTVRNCSEFETTVNDLCVGCIGGQYMDPETMDCRGCPDNANCPTGTYYSVHPGYWGSRSNYGVLYKCNIPDSCPGGSKLDFCSMGYTGVICGICADGYSMAGSGCMECPNVFLNLFAIILLILISCLVFCAIVYLFTTVTLTNSSVSKILTNYIQGIGIVSKTFQKTADIAEYGAFYQGISMISLTFDIISLKCIFPFYNYYWKVCILVLIAVVVPIVPTMVSLTPIALSFIGGKRKISSKVRWWSNHIRNMVLLTAITLLYPRLTGELFSIVGCREINGQFYLINDLSIKCYDFLYWIFLLFNTVAFLCFGVGAIVVQFVLLIVAKPSLDKLERSLELINARESVVGDDMQEMGEIVKVGGSSSSDDLRDKQSDTDEDDIQDIEVPKSMWDCLAFLRAGYRGKFFFWELLISFRKMALTTISATISNNTWKIYLTTSTLVLFSVLHYVCNPFRRRLDNFLESSALAALTLSVLCGFVFNADRFVNDQLIWFTSLPSAFFSALVVLLNFPLLAILLVLAILNSSRKLKNSCLKVMFTVKQRMDHLVYGPSRTRRSEIEIEMDSEE